MQTFLTDAGYWALIIFAFVEACCIPIPSEVTFGFAGVLAYDHKLSLALVIIIGSLAEFAGSYTSYAIGRKGGRRTVERFRRYVLMTRKDVERAERFLAGRGAWAVALGRVLPLVRAFTGLISGLAEVPTGPFAIFNLIGTVIYATAISLIGYSLAHDWNKLEKNLSYVGYGLVALVLVALVAYKLYELRKERAEDGQLADGPEPAPRARHRAPSNLRDR